MSLGAPPLTAALLALAALAAGFLDAIVGGGGLITMPALLLGLPGASFPVVLGTNKVLAVGGTSLAAGQYLKGRVLAWTELVPPVLCALAGGLGGSLLAYHVDTRFLGPLVLGLLAAMFLFTLLRPELGGRHAPRFGLTQQRVLSGLIGLGVGFYDGFFGAGSGSMLIFLFVAALGFDFLRASALAKAANLASDLSAMALFLARGSWLPGLAFLLLAANAVGGYLGARVALRGGSRWVRLVFLLVVGALLLRLGYLQVVR